MKEYMIETRINVPALLKAPIQFNALPSNKLKYGIWSHSFRLSIKTCHSIKFKNIRVIFHSSYAIRIQNVSKQTIFKTNTRACVRKDPVKTWRRHLRPMMIFFQDKVYIHIFPSFHGINHTLNKWNNNRRIKCHKR